MAAKQGVLLKDWGSGVKEQEELSWVPRHLSRLEMRWSRALWMERRSCVMVVKGGEVPPASLFLPDYGGNMGL